MTKSPGLNPGACVSVAKINRPLAPSPAAALARVILPIASRSSPATSSVAVRSALIRLPSVSISRAYCAVDTRNDASRSFGSISSARRSLADTNRPSTTKAPLRVPSKGAEIVVSSRRRCASASAIWLRDSELAAWSMRASVWVTTWRRANTACRALDAASSAVSVAIAVPTPRSARSL